MGGAVLCREEESTTKEDYKGMAAVSLLAQGWSVDHRRSVEVLHVVLDHAAVAQG